MGENLSSLFLLDPPVTFLNHGSFGACPRPVFEEYQRWQLQLERQPVAFLDPNRGLSGWMRDARKALASVVGANPDDICGALGYFLDSPSVTGQLLCVDGGQHLGWKTADILGIQP